MAKKLTGPWNKGHAIDLHTLSSEYIGDGPSGMPQFDTKRSEIGELVYQLKYQQNMKTVTPIANLVKKTIGNISRFDMIIPIPPSNKQRTHQPVLIISKKLAEMHNVEFISDALVKSKTEELKNVQDFEERIELLNESMSLQDATRFNDKTVLLFDDLYRSGATLTVATNLLYEQGKASEVCVLTLTKTRSNR
jgi:competence protein ComFC